MHIRLRRACLLAALSAIPAAGEASSWAFPAEAMSATSERLPCPVEVVRGESGAVGVFVFERDGGLTLRISKDGRAPWKVLLLPNGPAGEPVVEGDRVQVLLADADDKSVSLGVFDLVAQKDLSRVRIPGKLPGIPSFSRLAAQGPARFATVALESGELLYSRSADGGKSWSAFESVAKLAARGDACCPPLLVADDGVHLYFAASGGKLAHRVSNDGAAWKDGVAPPALPEEHGVPGAVTGTQVGKQFHLVVLTSKLRYLYNWSDDRGAHWGAWSVLAAPSSEVLGSFDLAATFRLKARGKTMAFTWTERGPKEGDPLHCRFLVSRTSGAKWENSSPAAGVKGSTGLATAYIGANGELTAAFAAAPGVRSGPRYVLVAGEGKGGGESGEEKKEWWGK
ncbi:MAG: hypothetical protein K8T20_00600 [Planctomycetes bacterium]|nr:hypothetical protein [Planctomycetota bacterium]